MTIERDQSLILILNMQLELVPLLENGSTLLNDCVWLADVANHLGLRCLIIEHKKLGAGSAALRDVAGGIEYLEKSHFDCTTHDEIRSKIMATGAEQIILAGAESHVCVLQTALGLRALGKHVFVLADTISARNVIDHDLALARMRQNEIQLITREMLFFEAIRHSEFGEYQSTAMKFLDGRYIR